MVKAYRGFVIREEYRFGHEKWIFLDRVRLPTLSIIQSTLDNSGDLPKSGKLTVRSVIERWAMEDWVRWEIPEQKIAATGYYEVFLGYWKR
jgi:hypothetical protein